MAAHGSSVQTPIDENVRLGPAGGAFKFGALGLGVVCLAIAVILAFFVGDAAGGTARRAQFYHAYLVGFCYCLTIALAGLFFTMMQHLVKVGWSVNVRRVPEALAGSLPWLSILAIPLLIPVFGQRGGELYPWAVPHTAGAEHHASAQPASGQTLSEQFVDASGHTATAAAAEHAASAPHAESAHGGVMHADDATLAHAAPAEHGAGEAGHAPGLQSTYDYMTYDAPNQDKQPWLTGWFFTLRLIFYFAVWTLLAWFFYGQSKRQDTNGDVEISKRLAIFAAPGIVAFALTLTFAMFDLVMSLDHHWYSTMFGVYCFAGGMVGMFATCIVTFNLLQSRGLVRQSVTMEHYHDLGKFMFAFVFFWGYVGFSQFMLQWYASIPEATPWWARRGVTSADMANNTIGLNSGFAGLSLVLLFGHFVIPFAFLISRHIKRGREALLVGALWMLGAHAVDIYWLVMPEWNNGEWTMSPMIVLTILGVIGLAVFAFVQTLGGANLRPIRDPRADESMGFLNM